jgi:hypothetical protein
MTTSIGLQTNVPHPKGQGGKAPAPSKAALQNEVQPAPSAKSSGTSIIQYGKQPGGYGGSKTNVGTLIK